MVQQHPVAGVVKLVYTPALGAGAARHEGSSPSTRTNFNYYDMGLETLFSSYESEKDPAPVKKKREITEEEDPVFWKMDTLELYKRALKSKTIKETRKRNESGKAISYKGEGIITIGGKQYKAIGVEATKETDGYIDFEAMD